MEEWRWIPLFPKTSEPCLCVSSPPRTLLLTRSCYRHPSAARPDRRPESRRRLFLPESPREACGLSTYPRDVLPGGPGSELGSLWRFSWLETLFDVFSPSTQAYA